MANIKHLRENDPIDLHKKKKHRRKTNLTPYVPYSITFYQRQDCQFLPENWMPLSGGHVEYHEDVDLKQCALR